MLKEAVVHRLAGAWVGAYDLGPCLFCGLARYSLLENRCMCC